MGEIATINCDFSGVKKGHRCTFAFDLEKLAFLMIDPILGIERVRFDRDGSKYISGDVWGGIQNFRPVHVFYGHCGRVSSMGAALSHDVNV